MADRSLRALCIAHHDFASVEDLPKNWKEVRRSVLHTLVQLIVTLTLLVLPVLLMLISYRQTTTDWFATASLG